MAKEGWIKLWRTLSDNSMWLDKPFSKGQAWVDLLLLAQGKDNKKFEKGKWHHYEKGKVYKSVLELSDRWGWSRGKTKRFLEMLKNDTTISFTSDTTSGTTITIDKWALYQTARTTNNTTSGTTKRTGDDTTRGHNKECIKNSKEDKEGGDASTSDEWTPPEPGDPEYDAWRNQ